MRKRPVTIIIPCFNEVRFTRACLESVFRYTGHPFEVVAVDNGSRDSTGRYLRGLARGPKKNAFLARFTAVRNARNRGVAAALNQGIALSGGGHVCYLNNDTVVTHAWLENLVRCAESDRRIGLVGCSTNPADGGKGPLSWGPEEIRRAGSVVSLAYRGRREPARFVHGFCMFIKRNVIDRVGLFDERFFPCAGEDLDYSLRARKAGFTLVNAKDVFVFHSWSKATGSRRFTRAYREVGRVKDASHALLVEKWGKEAERLLREAGARLPGKRA